MLGIGSCIARLCRSSENDTLPFVRNSPVQSLRLSILNYGSPSVQAQPHSVNRTLPDDPPKVQSLDDIPPHLEAPVDSLIAELDRSVMFQVRDIPRRK